MCGVLRPATEILDYIASLWVVHHYVNDNTPGVHVIGMDKRMQPNKNHHNVVVVMHYATDCYNFRGKYWHVRM